MPVFACGACGAENEPTDEALVRGLYRCHACGATNQVPAEWRRPAETPVTHDEPVQREPSFTPSAHNTPEAMQRAEREASRLGCLVAVLWR